MPPDCARSLRPPSCVLPTTGVSPAELLGTVSGAICPATYCLQLPGTPVAAWQRTETLPAFCGLVGPWVLMMTFLPLLLVLNQFAVSTAVGHESGITARVASPTTTWRRHCAAVSARTQTLLSLLAS